MAGQLQSINPGWDADRIFQEARKIVGAEMQSITYNEYLPSLIGSEFNRRVGAYRGYDPSTDSTISNGFTTGAYRGGHGLVQVGYTPSNVCDRKCERRCAIACKCEQRYAYHIRGVIAE